MSKRMRADTGHISSGSYRNAGRTPTFSSKNSIADSLDRGLHDASGADNTASS